MCAGVLPERFGHWNSVWKRFDRLSKAGVFEAFFDMLAEMSATAHLIQMFDSTIVRAHVSLLDDYLAFFHEVCDIEIKALHGSQAVSYSLWC